MHIITLFPYINIDTDTTFCYRYQIDLYRQYTHNVIALKEGVFGWKAETFHQEHRPPHTANAHCLQQWAAMSAAVIWQFAGWISPIPLWLIISISTDYILPLLKKYGVYNANKYFSRNK